ncbi:MAG TPA: UDP-N-acetylmuramoyl-L-alanine--D-glutamate ligase [Paludibacteraceae bacterium]|jgi:UDP-N-acetylmuramoylalanine--D-glutamate ligase|nr:UDP-N-acetylmuramoyl-L-alanine--D-glutamate ligase [Paludibacteraceae bacterium]HOS37955.1 UDP-N-acetylmuramoyl-L-alanine--D-glutamate ligase [Paludibacteraceae bacterium]HPD27351.1 UDP-N-acetylmuramoyl-L-alanine--D-glutamate ligase [Paludibacteraceae bacterium]HPK20430.1 UDP-N-acetylmuramoyl-L-alanine--D-glutamate ligase [Paludibacteraceae bacterium]HRU72505.1 UDP-N-acetylmuramoyl-L-alanine--D-glutamate ligase [Paludibacteraceae bacterium]
MKRLVILGGGESGVGTAILAKKQGYEVFLSDNAALKPEYKAELEKRGLAYEENQHTEALILNADEVVKSPGMSEKAPIIKALRAQGTPIVSEIEFASRYTNAKKICITGSNGKTTTTMLTYFILKNEGLNVGLAGNVGKSFAWQVAECDFDYYVIELSSFQLDGMYDFKANVSVILNITPDHLDRYDYKFQNYINSKFRILQNQTPEDAFIFWNDDPVLKAEIEKRNIKAQLLPFALGKTERTKAYVEEQNLTIESTEATHDNDMVMALEELSLRGTHNVYNSMAAGLAAQLVHIRKETIRKSLAEFQGVEHRLEYVATVRGVRYINDSKATNVNSCWYALESIKTPIVLILGGTDKGNDYSEIEMLVREKVHTLIFMGLDNKKLREFWADHCTCPMYEVTSIEDCVAKAYEVAKMGDTVLLSPCCASFDLFKNYEDRGDKFKACVRNL